MIYVHSPSPSFSLHQLLQSRPSPYKGLDGASSNGFVARFRQPMPFDEAEFSERGGKGDWKQQIVMQSFRRHFECWSVYVVKYDSFTFGFRA